MKTKIFCLLAVLALSSFHLAAQPSAPLATDLEILMTKVRAKVSQGQRSEAAYAAELQEFDTLLAAHSSEGAETASHILYLKAMMFLEVFQNNPKAIALVQQIKRDYPNSELGRKANDIVTLLSHADEGKRIQKTLFVSAMFPDFTDKDLAGQPVNSASFRGKVLLVDFGSTFTPFWCQQTTNVAAAYKKFHPQGFEVVTISLDEASAKLAAFAKTNGMNWKLICDGRSWVGKLPTKYGITTLPQNILVDRYGKIFARNLQGADFDAAITKALAYKAPAVTIVPASKMPKLTNAPAKK